MGSARNEWPGVVRGWCAATVVGALLTYVGTALIYGDKPRVLAVFLVPIFAMVFTWPALMVRFALGKVPPLWLAPIIGALCAGALYPLLHQLFEPLAGKPTNAQRLTVFGVFVGSGFCAGWIWQKVELQMRKRKVNK